MDRKTDAIFMELKRVDSRVIELNIVAFDLGDGMLATCQGSE